MKNKKLLFALTLMIILTVPIIAQISPTRAAQTAFTSFLFVSVAPNPVGVGQTVYVALFFDKPIPPPGALFGGTAYTNMTINIVPPSGSNITLGKYTSDLTGGVGSITFIPTTTGNYTFQGMYAGQNVGGVFTMNPVMSPPVTLVVQQAQVPTTSSNPLPTSYWTRPIYSGNFGWANTIGGNWYGLGRPGFTNTGGYSADGNNFQPYSAAPTTAHILWTNPFSIGGQPGGETTGNQITPYAAENPLQHYFEPIILSGILYYNLWSNTGENAGIRAVNIRNGQILWTADPKDVLIYGQIISWHNNEDYGSAPLLWASEYTGYGLIVPEPSVYDIIDPNTGNIQAKVTGVPNTLSVGFGTSPQALIDSNESLSGFACSGSILMYYTNDTYSSTGAATSASLTLWNSSRCISPNAVSGSLTGNYTWKSGIQWSVPLPKAATNYTIGEESNQAIVLTSYPLILPTFATQWGGPTATDIAYNPKTGQMLWGPVTQTLINGHELDLIAIGDGVYVRHDKDTNQLYGYSLATGKQLWGPTQLIGNALGHIYAGAAIAYGQCYIWDFGGYVNAVNLTTGALDWTYTRGSAGYNTPYGIYPIWVFGEHSIADGMLFLSEGRYYDPPLFPNGEKLAINCTTGKLVWEINGAFQRDPCPIADGEMLGQNGYDMQIYAFGMGPSKTTVTAPDVGVTTATPVTITGTVTDISAGSQQNVVAANFPNGLPCVSDASMTPFMEAVYEQQPMPTNVTGVTVALSVIDANHNTRIIGTTSTDASGFYSYTWTPNIVGNYTVTATFAGSNSYYESSAQTAFYA